MSEWESGKVVAGRYRLIDKLGQGGMGSVWRAEDLELNAQVAVKLLDPAVFQNAELLSRFQREARASASLTSRHVVRVYDHGIEEDAAFMIMELLHGETLGARIRRSGPLGAEETGRFLSQIMHAIGRAHEQGIVHRDLKPDNIFLTADEEGPCAKVLDFGVAKVAHAELDHADGLRTQAGVMLGTPYYMSPEQAKAKGVDHRTDIWALSVITFECLLGKRTFSADSFADLLVKLCTDPLPIPSAVGQVPPGFDEWFARGTRRDVERRFTSAREMAAELMQLLQPSRAGGSTSASSAREQATPPLDFDPARHKKTIVPSRSYPAVAPVVLPLSDRRNPAFDLDRPRAAPRELGGLGLAVLAILGAAGIGAALAILLPPRGEAALTVEEAQALETLRASRAPSGPEAAAAPIEVDAVQPNEASTVGAHPVGAHPIDPHDVDAVAEHVNSAHRSSAHASTGEPSSAHASSAQSSTGATDTGPRPPRGRGTPDSDARSLRH